MLIKNRKKIIGRHVTSKYNLSSIKTHIVYQNTISMREYAIFINPEKVHFTIIFVLYIIKIQKKRQETKLQEISTHFSA